VFQEGLDKSFVMKEGVDGNMEEEDLVDHPLLLLQRTPTRMAFVVVDAGPALFCLAGIAIGKHYGRPIEEHCNRTELRQEEV
jgi:hypothetical protein